MSTNVVKLKEEQHVSHMHVCAGSSPMTGIKKWRLGATGHCFIKIPAKESMVVGKTKGNSGNFRKAIRDNKEHPVMHYFKLKVQSSHMQFCSLWFTYTVGEGKEKSKTQIIDVSRNYPNIITVTYHKICFAEMSSILDTMYKCRDKAGDGHSRVWI